MDINGKIFDPQGGLNDLKNKILNFIGDPQKEYRGLFKNYSIFKVCSRIQNE